MVTEDTQRPVPLPSRGNELKGCIVCQGKGKREGERSSIRAFAIDFLTASRGSVSLSSSNERSEADQGQYPLQTGRSGHFRLANTVQILAQRRDDDAKSVRSRSVSENRIKRSTICIRCAHRYDYTHACSWQVSRGEF